MFSSSSSSSNSRAAFESENRDKIQDASEQCMAWLESIDLSILRLIRDTLRNPLFDWLMPRLSANVLLAPVVAIAAVGLVWKGGTRGRLCLFMVVFVVLVGDNVICNAVKKAVGRSRPPNAAEYVVPDQSASHSMPSSHAANLFAATTVAFLYYRRSLWFMLPLAVGVAYSRIYKGAHYPSDVLVGAALGVAYGFGIVWLLDLVWQRAGRRWFPLWWARVPSLFPIVEPPNGKISAGRRETAGAALKVGREPSPHPGPLHGGEGEPLDGPSGPSTALVEEAQWLRLGYVLIFVLLLARLAYVASGQIQLGIDEAYQWVWSKHLALSYYSKPPLIAYVQRLGTTLWGDTAFGVRFFSPISAALVSWLLLRFLSRQGYVRAGFWLVLISAATPLLEIGATVLTVDCLLVLFWTAAMVSGWRAVEQNSLDSWLWTGLWMGLGCLSKYTALFQPVCWAIFFLLCKPARIRLRTAGPYVALAITLLCTLPIWFWNAHHGWITLSHVASNARVDRAWKPTLSYLFDFTGAELALLNPIFFVAALWAAIGIWRGREGVVRMEASETKIASSPRPSPPSDGGEGEGPRNLAVYLFSMGAPLFLGYWLYTLHSKVQPNWIAASLIPLFCLMAVYWESKFREGVTAVRGWLTIGISLGLSGVIVLHDTNLVARIAHRPLPPANDPLRQVRAWPETIRAVAEARAKLLAEGRPVFIICAHYGLAGELSFYMPEAKAGVPDHRLVYYQSSAVPINQFYFWPGYESRKGQNAIYVLETDHPQPPPEGLRREFAQVTDIGMKEILYRGQIFRHLQLFECRDLR